MGRLLPLLLLLACAEASPRPTGSAAQAMPACGYATEGEAMRGCRCEWSEFWGHVWVTVEGGYHGAADWCPRASGG